MGSLEHSFIPTPGVSGLYYSVLSTVPYYPLSLYRSICTFTHTNAIRKYTSPTPAYCSASNAFYFWLVCHAALDAASRLCFSGFLLEFIPMKIGAGMTIIVKGFMGQFTRANYYMLWVIRCHSHFGSMRVGGMIFLIEGKRVRSCNHTFSYPLHPFYCPTL